MKIEWMRIAAVAVLGGGLVLAQTGTQPAPAPQPGTGQRQHSRGMMLERLAQYLNLTDAQRAEAKTVLQQARQSGEPLKEQLKQNRQAMQDAVKANNTSQIQQLAANQGVILGQLIAIGQNAHAKIYSNLTPEQKAKADTLRDHFRNMFQQRFRQWRGPRTNG